MKISQFFRGFRRAFCNCAIPFIALPAVYAVDERSPDFESEPEQELRQSPTDLRRDVRTAQLDILRGVRDIEALEAAINAAPRVHSSQRGFSGNDLFPPFERLVVGLAALRAGFLGEAFQIASGTGSSKNTELDADAMVQLHRLRGLLLARVLPKYLELRDPIAIDDGESVSDYLLRVTAELARKRRFVDASRVLETFKTVAYGSAGQQSPSWVDADIQGLRSFVAAERLATAESWAEAINSFRKAADVAGKFTPSSEAAQRLAELSKAHPEEARNAARIEEAEALYERLSRAIADDAARALEARMPPEIRNRMIRP